MRNLPSLLVPSLAVLVLASCLGPGPGPQSRQNEIIERPLYQVSGRVIDSASGAPLANLRIGVSGTRVTTDSLGRYTALADSGMVQYTVVDPRYEAYDRSFLIQWPQTLDLNLRRLAPLITCFEVDADSIVAFVIDVQHRKTIHRSVSTNVSLSGPNFELSLLGNQWIWEAVDDFTYRMVVRPGVTGVQHAEWHILDQSGVVYTATCTAPSSCDHLPGSNGCGAPASPDDPSFDRVARSSAAP
ncbi:MAG: hypothetical protein HKM89_05310 [Gemmatimonadales bacterium]|nr:hypothetical protein [Gemmatimonadales bacterium]